jgi:hypothetical protein
MEKKSFITFSQKLITLDGAIAIHILQMQNTAEA